MKKSIVAVAMLAVFGTVEASWETHCGDIQRMRTWANGSDTYGVWVEYVSNPASCSGGYYLNHAATNKSFVYSFLLSAKTAKQRICIQTDPTVNKNGSRCRINYVMDP